MLAESMGEFAAEFEDYRDSFEDLFIITKEKPYIQSKLNLDDGLQEFQRQACAIIQSQSSDDNLLKFISTLMDRITTVLSDWFACVIPDTAGLAGSIMKTLLNRIVTDGFSLIYSLIGALSPENQQLLTNHPEMKSMMKKFIEQLPDLLEKINPDDITRGLTAAADKVPVPAVLEPYMKYFSGKSNRIIGYAIGTIGNNVIKQKLIDTINNTIIPSISSGVDIFNQLFPIFLIFVLFSGQDACASTEEQPPQDQAEPENDESDEAEPTRITPIYDTRDRSRHRPDTYEEPADTRTSAYPEQRSRHRPDTYEEPADVRPGYPEQRSRHRPDTYEEPVDTRRSAYPEQRSRHRPNTYEEPVDTRRPRHGLDREPSPISQGTRRHTHVTTQGKSIGQPVSYDEGIDQITPVSHGTRKHARTGDRERDESVAHPGQRKTGTILIFILVSE